MKFFIKLIFRLGLLSVLILGVLVMVVAYLDPNDYKDTLAANVKEATGRDLSIEGNIELTYYPWLGLELEGLTLGNATGFGDAPMLQTKTVKARARLLPLLRKELKMDTLVLHGARINLARNAEGVTNWDDLASGEKKESGGMPFAALVLGGIDIKDANVFWQDQQQGVQYSIKHAAISTGELKLGEPIDIKAAMQLTASKPALSSDISFSGTIAYDESGDQFDLNPMLLEALIKGAAIPGGETKLGLSAEISVDMSDEIARIKQLDFKALGTQLSGQVEVANFQSGKPVIKGTLDLNGQDLPQVFKILEIEPLASQLATLPEKRFEIKTTFDADLQRNDIDLAPLQLTVLGNAVDAEIFARNIQSKTPAVKGTIKASGLNLPALLAMASQLKGDSKEKTAALSKQLAFAPAAFSINSEFDVDLKAGSANVPTFSMNALGLNTLGEINGHGLDSDSPELKGGLTINGDDLHELIAIAAAFGGSGKQDIDFLKKQLQATPKQFAIEADFDSGSNAVEIRRLAINTLGLTTDGALNVKNVMSDKPAVSGELTMSGPDLPLLMLVAGSLSSGDSGLVTMAKDLGTLRDKKFSVASQFATDLKSGTIDLLKLDMQGLGVSLVGDLKGKNIDSNGKLEGNVTLISGNPKPLLVALDQAGLAEGLSSFKMSSGINGNARQLALTPFSFDAIFSGKDIPNSPVTLAIRADSEIDLEKEVFNLGALTVTGLGLDVKGSVKAMQFKSDPQFSGQLAVAPFDLRNVMQTLKQEMPVTADPKVLKRVAISSSFSGSANTFNLKDLKAELDDTKLQGDINVKQFTPLALEFGLGVDQLNADRYLPPKTGGSKNQAATPETVVTGAATEIPVETLRALDIKGDFVMGQFVVSNAKLSDLQLGIRAEGGKIKLAPVAAELYGGSYTGEINLDATGNEPRLTSTTQLTGVQTGPLLTDLTGKADLLGEVNINLALNASGADTNKLKSRLAGTGDIKFNDGALIGVDVPKVLRQVEIIYESKRPTRIDTAGETRFDSLTATLDIKNGVVDNQDLLMTAAGFKVEGQGMMINLNDETWKYNLNVIVDPGSVTEGTEHYNTGGYDILIKCRGKIASKRCLPDIESMINALVKDTTKKKIRDVLTDKLGIKLPGGAASTPSPPPQQAAPAAPEKAPAPAPAEPQPEVPKDPINEFKDKAVKELFDKLF